MASEIRVNKIENRSGLGTVTFADTGVDLAGIVTATTFSGSGASLTNLPAANVTGTLPAISGANLTNLPAANLTGALPAISGANLTGIAATDNVRTGILDVAGVSTFRNTMNVGAAVTISESGIEATGIGITVANINGGQIGGRRNIIINGAMNVAQRGTSRASTSQGSGHATVDRFQLQWNNFSVAAVESQGNVGASDTPYTLGFRKYHRITLASAGTMASGTYVEYLYKVEAQDMAASGWNYTSPSSFITFSFWFRCSTNQTFYGVFRTSDGTGQGYAFSFTATGNDEWTKVIKTIPGNSNITFDNDNGQGLLIYIFPVLGANYTDSSQSLNAWGTFSGSSYCPDMDSTWLTAGASTFDLTGVQLEVGSQATPFEHRSYSEEIRLCMRYFQKVHNTQLLFSKNTSTRMRLSAQFMVPMRGTPSYTRTSNQLSAQGVATNVSSSDTTEAQGGNTAVSDGISYSRQWDFGGFSNLQDRSHGGANGNAVFHLDSEL